MKTIKISKNNKKNGVSRSFRFVWWQWRLVSSMPPLNSVSELSVIIMLTVIDLQFSACKSYYFVVVVCVFSWSHQSCWVILSYAATPSHGGCIQSQSNLVLTSKHLFAHTPDPWGQGGSLSTGNYES